MFLRCFLSLILAGAALSAFAADLPAYPFIHVEATGSMVAMPDIGQIDFEVAAVDKDPAQARKVVEERLSAIRSLMAQTGVNLADLEVRDIRTIQHKGEVPSYELRAAVKIMVRELARWKAVVEPLLEQPNLDGFVTAFDSTDRERIETELLNDALRLARRKADGIAAGMGRKVLTVGGVSTSGIKNLSRSMNFTPTDYRADRSRDNQTARSELAVVNALKMAQPVDVIFRLK